MAAVDAEPSQYALELSAWFDSEVSQVFAVAATSLNILTYAIEESNIFQHPPLWEILKPQPREPQGRTRNQQFMARLIANMNAEDCTFTRTLLNERYRTVKAAETLLAIYEGPDNSVSSNVPVARAMSLPSGVSDPRVVRGVPAASVQIPLIGSGVWPDTAHESCTGSVTGGADNVITVQEGVYSAAYIEAANILVSMKNGTNANDAEDAGPKSEIKDEEDVPAISIRTMKARKTTGKRKAEEVFRDSNNPRHPYLPGIGNDLSKGPALRLEEQTASKRRKTRR